MNLTKEEQEKVQNYQEVAKQITQLEQRWGDEEKCKHEWKVLVGRDWEGVLTMGARCRKCGKEEA
jgi:hypothetical protein